MADPTHAEVEAALAILAAAEAARAAEALRAAEAAAAPAVAAPTVEPVIHVTPPVVDVTPPVVIHVTPPLGTPPSPFAARIATLNEFAAIYMAYTPLPNVSGFENDALARAFDRQQVNALTNVLSK